MNSIQVQEYNLGSNLNIIFHPLFVKDIGVLIQSIVDKMNEVQC